MPENNATPTTYVMLGKGIFRHRGVTYGPRLPTGNEITTTTDLPRLFPGLFAVKGEHTGADNSATPTQESIGEDVTDQISEALRKAGGVSRVVKIGETYIAFDAANKIIANGSLADIESGLV
jgi:hypothetical protein